jgi:hypothetical protein
MLTCSLTYRGLVCVGCRVSRSICGGRISHWLVGVGPAAPRAPSIDAVAPNTGLLCCDVTPDGGATRTTFALTTVSRVSWSRPVGPLKHKNTILWDGSAELHGNSSHSSHMSITYLTDVGPCRYVTTSWSNLLLLSSERKSTFALKMESVGPTSNGGAYVANYAASHTTILERLSWRDLLLWTFVLTVTKAS